MAKYQVEPAKGEPKPQKNPKPRFDKQQVNNSEEEAFGSRLLNKINNTKNWETKSFRFPPDVCAKLSMISSAMGVTERDLVLDAIESRLDLWVPEAKKRMLENLDKFNA